MSSSSLNVEVSKHHQSKCQVCFMEDNDTYFKCMDCNITVHETCYGLSWIDIESENLFICDPCKQLRKIKKKDCEMRCCVCPLRGGALKKTSCNQWCHIFCALWIPELAIANIMTKSPILDIQNIASFRKNKKCCICKVMDGTSVCIKCEYHECSDYVHPICTTTIHHHNHLFVHQNKDSNMNNHLVSSAMHKLGRFLWYFLCPKHIEMVNVNDIKRIEILKLLSAEWPYWKIHPNAIFMDKIQINKYAQNNKNDDKMMAILDLMDNDKLLLSSLPTQKMIKRYENIIYAMNNMAISLSTNIGPIGLLNHSIKDKYDKNTKFATNLNKTSVSLIWNELQNKLNYNISINNDNQEAKNEDINPINPNIPLYDKLKRDDMELSRNEVINLLWNSKEKFFGDITCCRYLRISPYDIRNDPSFSVPLIGHPFFDKKTNETVKNMTAIHHYNFDDEQSFNDDNMTLNKSMGLPQPIDYKDVPHIMHRLGSNKTRDAFNIDFNNMEHNGNKNKWDGQYSTYLTENDPIGWRWVLNRWNPPKHLECVNCICLQCKETVDIYNKKYVEAINDYKYIESILPKYRENDDTDKMVIDTENDNNTKSIADPKILYIDNNTNNNSRKIPVIIKSKHGKVLAHFVAPHNNNNNGNVLDIDFGVHTPPIYDKMNAILESKSTSAEERSLAALRALYGQNDSNGPPLKRRKLNNGNTMHIDDMVELDSFRSLQNIDVLNNSNDGDSLFQYLSDTVYDLYGRMRSNDSIKHMIRTNLSNKIKSKSQIEYEKLHEIVVKHCIEHCCIWLRIRRSLCRGYSDLSGTFSIPSEGGMDEDYSVCTVCFDGSFSDENPIVFCDDCNVGIHRYCYGIDNVPNENESWYCDGCQWIIDNDEANKSVQCCLCPIKGCALKQTSCGGFAHVACALWIKGIDIGNLCRMAPMCGVLTVQKQQTQSAIKIHGELLENGVLINNGLLNINNAADLEWRHECIVCGDDNGCFIECSESECMCRMHVLCGWFAGYAMNISCDDNVSVVCVVYCNKHTPLEFGGNKRDLNYYKEMRGNGTTEKKNENVAFLRERNDKYCQVKHKLSIFPDKYIVNQCSVCFTDYADYDDYMMMKCIECGIQVHRACYNVPNNHQLLLGWKCDVCSPLNDIVECMLCPRRGGAFKKMNGEWIHVSCGQWNQAMRFNKKLNEFEMISSIKSKDNDCNICYLCNTTKNENDLTISCQYRDCKSSFHAICGLFGDCYLSATLKNNNNDKNEFEFGFYCRRHNDKIKFDKLGQHLLSIKRLRRKLDKITVIEERVTEYQVNQRGIITETTRSFKQSGARHPSNKTKKKKRKKCCSKKEKEKEKEKDERKKKRKKKEKKEEKKEDKDTEKENSKESTEEIRMATDIWAEQYQYEGGEIKWPVIKRNGWFMCIPRLKLPKSNKYRYSHVERKQKQELLDKENEMNDEWGNFLSIIKEKEIEMNDEIDYNDDDESEYHRYKAGGSQWELTNDLNQPYHTDHSKHNTICPYCHKVKQPTISQHNWSRHLNARHVFKCKKCQLYFTRHRLLTLHLEQCK